MIYHIVVGDEAAKPLLAAVSGESPIAGEAVVLKDILHVGPILRADGQSFSVLRSEWWQQVSPHEKQLIIVDDLERLLQVSNELYKDADAQAWYWLAPGPGDVMGYHWALPYLAKHTGRFYLVNIANLPFLDEAGKVFYPKSIAELLPRELLKARKLARAVTAAEIEMDGDTWQRLATENAGIRIYEGGRKMTSRGTDYYDEKLLQHCTGSFLKAGRVLAAAMSKEQLPTGDMYLAWRLRELAKAARLELQGDATKSYRDWEVRLAPASTAEAATEY